MTADDEWEVDDDWDVEAAEYRSLDATAHELADAWRERFLDRFFEISELSTRRRPEAKQMLRLDEGREPDGSRLLRVEFPFMGSTQWAEWDGSEASALEVAEEFGWTAGYNVGHDQAHGPTGWETDYD